MASARGIRAGAAYVELYASDNKLIRGLRSAQRRLRAFSVSVRDFGMRMSRVTAMLATPLALGAKVYADFEQQMANVSTMLDRPADHMEKFRKGIRRMSVEFGESTETLAAGLYDILSASIPAENALEVLAVAARAAKAGLTDTGTAADAITTMLNSYGLSAERAADMSDLLFQIVRRGKLTFSDLAPNIGNVASLASTAGVSLEEMGASVALLTRNGIKTEEAITALRAIIQTFLKPSAEATALAKRMGFEMKAATLESEGLAGVLERISKLPPEAIAKLFPNVRALKGVLPALSALEGFAEDIETMKGRAGAAQTAYQKMTRTLSHSFAQLKQSAVAVLSVVGEAMSGPFGRAAKSIRRILQSSREWIEQNQSVVISALKIVGALGLVSVSLVALGTAGATMAFVFGGIASIVSGFGTALGIMGTILGALLTPIGAIAVGVAAVGSVILFATDIGAKALDWLGQRFDSLKRIALATWQGIGDALAAGDISLAAKVLWLSLKMAWTQGIETLSQLWLGFKHSFLTIVAEAFWGTARVVAHAWSALQSLWVETVSFLQDVWSRFTSGVLQGWNQTQDALTKGWLEVMGLFDEELDVGATKRQVDIDTTHRDTRLESKVQRTKDEREKVRGERLAEIQQGREETLAGLSEMAGRQDWERRQKHAEQMRKSEDELNKARQDWRGAISKARQKNVKVSSEGEGQDEKKPVVPELVEKLKEQLSNVGGALNIDVAGTFNAMAVQSLQGNSSAERTARATEETAKNTKRILEEAREGGLAFS